MEIEYMDKITRTMLADKIRFVLNQLWLYEEFHKFSSTGIQIGIQNRTQILKSASEFAVNGLQAIEEGEDIFLEETLAGLCHIESENIVEAEQFLRQTLNTLTTNFYDLTVQDKIQFLDDLTVSIIHKVKQILDFAEARNELNLLDSIARVAARLSFSENAKLSSSLDRIIRDFEHSDEETVLISIYEDIQHGDYLM
jgi:hypothetical protein